MQRDVRVRVEHRNHPNVRKLARALISLARRELAQAEAEDKPRPARKEQP